MSVQCILEGQQDSTKFDKAGGTITVMLLQKTGIKFVIQLNLLVFN